MLDRIVVVRHAHRLDTHCPEWKHSNADPWNTPLSEQGVEESHQLAKDIQQALQANSQVGQNVKIITSPFLRCLSTTMPIAETLKAPIYFSTVFGEWMFPDYFTHGAPPDDNHSSLISSGISWMTRNHPALVSLLRINPFPGKWGDAGVYGESWVEMHTRVCQGLRQVLMDESLVSDTNVLIIVTHGSVCNSLLSAIRQTPQVNQIPLASYAIELIPDFAAENHDHESRLSMDVRSRHAWHPDQSFRATPRVILR